MDALAIQELTEHEMDRCYACSVRCKKRVKITRPDLEVDPKYGGPEYETMAAIGPNTGVIDVMAVCKGHEMLNALGMDSISCGATIAWAMEMVELGLMDGHRLNGETLNFGSADDLLRVIGKIARREGVGDLLAEGSLRAARTLGADGRVAGRPRQGARSSHARSPRDAGDAPQLPGHPDRRRPHRRLRQTVRASQHGRPVPLPAVRRGRDPERC